MRPIRRHFVLPLVGAVTALSVLVGVGCDGQGESDPDAFYPDWSDAQADTPLPPADARNWDSPPIPGKCWGDEVNHTECPIGPCECVEFEGSLLEGGQGPVDWLVDSQCVPEAQRSVFLGEHLFFGTQLSHWCGVFACVTPKVPGTQLGVYAVRLDALVCSLPQPEGSFFECDAAWDKASSQSEEWTGNLGDSCPAYAATKAADTLCVEVTSGTDEQNYLVGVTGPADLQQSDFTLHFIWRNDCGT